MSLALCVWGPPAWRPQRPAARAHRPLRLLKSPSCRVTFSSNSDRAGLLFIQWLIITSEQLNGCTKFKMKCLGLSSPEYKTRVVLKCNPIQQARSQRGFSLLEILYKRKNWGNMIKFNTYYSQQKPETKTVFQKWDQFGFIAQMSIKSSLASKMT